MIYLTGFIVVAVKVFSILIGCVRPAPANRRRCWPGRGGVWKIQGPAGVSAVLEWQGGGGEGHGFSYLPELHMTYLAGSHILRSWPGIRLYIFCSSWQAGCPLLPLSVTSPFQQKREKWSKKQNNLRNECPSICTVVHCTVKRDNLTMS